MGLARPSRGRATASLSLWHVRRAGIERRPAHHAGAGQAGLTCRRSPTRAAGLAHGAARPAGPRHAHAGHPSRAAKAGGARPAVTGATARLPHGAAGSALIPRRSDHTPEVGHAGARGARVAAAHAAAHRRATGLAGASAGGAHARHVHAAHAARAGQPGAAAAVSAGSTARLTRAAASPALVPGTGQHTAQIGRTRGGGSASVGAHPPARRRTAGLGSTAAGSARTRRTHAAHPARTGQPRGAGTVSARTTTRLSGAAAGAALVAGGGDDAAQRRLASRRGASVSAATTHTWAAGLASAAAGRTRAGRPLRHVATTTAEPRH
jgi:hypothetical protein